jgi:hypothetical protein
MTTLQSGQMAGPYQIISQIGMAGMTTVYKTYHATSKFHPVKNTGLVISNLRKKVWSCLQAYQYFFENAPPITSQKLIDILHKYHLEVLKRLQS